MHKLDPHMALERRDDALRLVSPQQAVIDEDAGELVAHGPLHQRRRYRGIDAAGEGAEHPVRTDLAPDVVDALRDDVAGRPVAAQAADAIEEVLDDPLAVGRVHHLRVELQSDQPLAVPHRGDGRAIRIGKRPHAGRRLLDAVAVAHPNRHALGQPFEQRCGTIRALALMDDRWAVLARFARRYLPAKLFGEELHAVADAEHRQPALEHVVRRARRPFFVDARRPAREDERARMEPLDLLLGRVVRDQLAVDVALAHPPRDEHAVLRAEVEDDDRLGPLRVAMRRGSFGSGSVLRAGSACHAAPTGDVTPKLAAMLN